MMQDHTSAIAEGASIAAACGRARIFEAPSAGAPTDLSALAGAHEGSEIECDGLSVPPTLAGLTQVEGFDESGSTGRGAKREQNRRPARAGS